MFQKAKQLILPMAIKWFKFMLGDLCPWSLKPKYITIVIHFDFPLLRWHPQFMAYWYLLRIGSDT